MVEQVKEYWSLSPEEKRSRRRFHALHLATAVFTLCGLAAVFIDNSLLYALILPLGFPMLGVFIYSLVKLPRFERPRWREVTVTGLLIPGCWVPLIGIAAYLFFSLTCFCDFNSRPRDEVPADRTTCDECGRRFPSRYYLKSAGSRGFLCLECSKTVS